MGLADDGSGKVEFHTRRGELVQFTFEPGTGPRRIHLFTTWNNCVKLFDPL